MGWAVAVAVALSVNEGMAVRALSMGSPQPRAVVEGVGDGIGQGARLKDFYFLFPKGEISERKHSGLHSFFYDVLHLGVNGPAWASVIVIFLALLLPILFLFL